MITAWFLPLTNESIGACVLGTDAPHMFCECRGSRKANASVLHGKLFAVCGTPGMFHESQVSVIFNEKLKIAYEKSDEIIKGISFLPNKMIDTSLVLDYVRRHYCPKLEVFIRSFSALSSAFAPAGNCGAMMRIVPGGTSGSATIILNGDMPAAFQRFSLMQQIGHLVTLPADIPLDPDSYNISTHINYDVTGITREDVENNHFLMREQVANIFALRVLMPGEQFYRIIRQLDSVSKTAQFFGLADEAVISRMMIGA